MKSVTGPPADALEVSDRRWLRWMWVPVVFVAVVAGLWWLGHPQDLPTNGTTVTATTKAGQPVYIGVLGTSGKDRRNLDIDEVEIPVTGGQDSSEVETEALICKGGSIGQTSDPERFCQEVVPAEGNALYLDGGDQLIISVSSETDGTVELGRVEISFREGLQRGTLPAGSTYSIEILG